MSDSVFTFLVGGKAGEGVKKAGSVGAALFSKMGRAVFQMDDYQSLIRGGHNFSVISTAKGTVTSHYMKADLVVALDKKSVNLHRDHVAPDGVMVYNSDAVDGADGIGIPMLTEAKKFPDPKMRIGVCGAAVLAVAVGLTKDELKQLIESEYPRDLENNIAYAGIIYESASEKLEKTYSLEKGGDPLPLVFGNQAIGLGALSAGLDLYIAYPMTPASSLMHFFAKNQKEFGTAVMHVESEIAVANMVVGAAFTGARAMAGTSGGGLALMEEALSLAGIAEAPVLFMLSQRPGPATGVPTYTSQGDLEFVLNVGHGEFPRIVGCPGSIEEAFYLTAEMMNLVWEFQTPGIIATEKHMSESTMTVSLDPDQTEWAEPLMHTGGEFKRYTDTDTGISPLLFPPSPEVIKWSSYEHDELGVTTEEGSMIAAMNDKRNKKQAALIEKLKGMKTVNVFGSEDPVIAVCGSTCMSALEALRAGGIEATVVQPRYLRPFPVWEMEQFKGRDVITVETNSTAQFTTLLKDKTGIEARRTILKYDGRAFDPIELAQEIKGV
jgi:2-oxoglutarate ferredoxin oxidoreductase subunit alpha